MHSNVKLMEVLTVPQTDRSHKMLFNPLISCPNINIIFVLPEYLKNGFFFQPTECRQDQLMVTKVTFIKCNKYFASTLNAIFSLCSFLPHPCLSSNNFRCNWVILYYIPYEMVFALSSDTNNSLLKITSIRLLHFVRMEKNCLRQVTDLSLSE